MLQRRDFIKSLHHPPAAPVAAGYWLHVSRTAMACRFEITLPQWERDGVSAAQRALDEIDKLERQLTVFSDDSEVSFVNRNAAFGPVAVESQLFALLLLCRELYRETGGAFDVTSGPLTRCWGFLRREGRIPVLHELAGARALVGSDKLMLDGGAQSVGFARAGVEINLGSIGKGYALDRVAAQMRGGVRAALLNAGASSVLAVGSGEDGRRGWLVGLRHPRDKERRMAVLRLRDCALSTSGGEEQFFVHEGRRYGHIIDPRSGQPADRVSGVTVVAPTAARADALATALYVGGPELAERICAEQPGVMAVMLESGAERPVVFGASDKCEVEIVNE